MDVGCWLFLVWIFGFNEEEIGFGRGNVGVFGRWLVVGQWC